jgi:predicted hexulose-6-phosphate isomerase
MVKNKAYQLGLYEKAMPSTMTWLEKLNQTKSAGFDWLEISVDESDAKLSRLDYSKTEINEIKDAMNETSVPILTMCLSGHRKYPLGSHDLNTRNKSLEIMQKAIDLASALGVRIIQLAGYDVYYETSDESTKELFSVNLNKCVQMAAKAGIILAFETMETLFMDTCKKSMHYVNLNNSPYLQIYPDVGNLTNASRISGISVKEDLEAASGHIAAAHLKEIIEGHYREIPFGTGDTHYDEALEVLAKQGVRMFTGEFWYIGSVTWEADLAFANTYLRSKIEKYIN